MTTRPVCPCCEQDRLHPYRFRTDGARFLVRTECDALWWPGVPLEAERAEFLDDVVAARLGVPGNPWEDRVWADVIEPVR